MGSQTIIRTVALPVEIRHPAFVREPRNQGGTTGTQNVRLWAFFFYTWNQGNPTDWDAIVSTRFQKGYNWALWQAALEARITARGGTIADEIKTWTQQLGGVEHPGGAFIELRKKAVLDAASMCHIAVFGHSPPKEHLQYVQQVSLVGTRPMTGLHNFESCKQATEWNSVIEPERLVSRANVLDGKAATGCGGASVNAYGCTAIDKYEKLNSCAGYSPSAPDATDLCSANACGAGSPPSYLANYVACPHASPHAGLPANADPNSKHTWDCDVRISAYRTNLIAALKSKLDTYYLSGGAYATYGHLFDNHGDPYRGDATLAFPDSYTTTAYWQAWRDFDSAFQEAIATWPVPDRDLFYWANAGDAVTTYSAGDLRNRWSEFYFVTGGATSRLWSEIESGLVRVRDNNLRVVMGMTGTFTQQHVWATTAGGPNPATNGTWARIVAKIRELGIEDRMYAQVLRQTAGGYAFWQEGFQPLA